MSVSRNKATLAALAGGLTFILYAGCERATTDASAPVGVPNFTLSSGSQSTLLSRATFADPSDQTFKVKRISGDWHAEVKATPSLDIAVQRIVFQPGGQSGWHRHPGPVFIEVVSGTMTFYMSDDPTCAPMVRTAGQGYLDVGAHPHIARNESSAPAENIVVYMAPQGATLRIDAADPGTCPF
ncbi:MAG: cupin domain-containing protein [Gemmatimonadales bacterium]